MPVVNLTDEQVIELFRQLPEQRRRAALLALAASSRNDREGRLEYATTHLRQLCVARGLNWDTMSEEEREVFVDNLAHEDRRCRG